MWVKSDLGQRSTVGMIRLWNRGSTMGITRWTFGSKPAWTAGYGTRPSPGRRCDASLRERTERLPLGVGLPVGGEYSRRSRLGAIRITQYEENTRYPWMIGEAYVYEDSGPRARARRKGAGGVLPRIPGLGLGPGLRGPMDEREDRGILPREDRTVTPFTIAVAAF